MIDFDEDGLASKFGKLDAYAGMAFALCCADRLRRELITRGGDEHLVDLITSYSAKSWSALRGASDNCSKAQQGQLVELIPDEDDISSLAGALAHFAGLSMAYAIRCVPEEDFVQNLVWAARAASDAVNAYAARFVNESVFTTTAEAFIDEHPVVQRERARQQRDIQICANRWRDRQKMLKELETANEGERVLSAVE